MKEIYYYIVLMVIILGLVMPQEGKRRKSYIVLMAILHSFVCGFRYMYLTGDLRNYAADYYDIVRYGWFSSEVVQEGRNTGFFWMMKFVSTLTNGNFQIFLILITLIIEVTLAVMIYRYSPCPWLSYLVWNCMGFYITGFSAIKQALAMAFIMCAMMAIFEENLKKYLLFILLATAIHMPAIAFLPAYWIAKNKINFVTVIGYLMAGGVIYLFRNQLVAVVAAIYYEEEQLEMFNTAGGLGGRFFVLVLILLCGIILKGFKERNFQSVFNVIAIAAIFQMFSSFDNVFTRFADYYFQFAVLYIPMIFYEAHNNVKLNTWYMKALLPFNRRSIRVFVIALAVVLIGYYQITCLGQTITNAVDDYLSFRFMWDVPMG